MNETNNFAPKSHENSLLDEIIEAMAEAYNNQPEHTSTDSDINEDECELVALMW